MSNIDILRNAGYEPIGNYESQVRDAEKQLGLTFAPDFRQYLVRYGQLTINDAELTGIISNDFTNVITSTIKERKNLNNNTNEIYVVEYLGIDGIIIWQHVNGEIIQTIPNGDIQTIYKSFEDYLLNDIL